MTRNRTVATLLAVTLVLSVFAPMATMPVAAASGDEPVWNNSTDWDGASSEDRVVHTNYGDHTDNRIEQGYDPFYDNLTVYLPMDEDSGTTIEDASGNGYDGTLLNGTTNLGAEGFANTSGFYYDKENQGVNITEDEQLQIQGESFTVGAYLNPDIVTNQQTWWAFGQKGDGGTKNISGKLKIKNASGGVEFASYNSEDGTSGSFYTASWADVMPDNETWYHIVVSYNKTTDEISLYRNGTLVGTKTLDLSSMQESNYSMQVGYFKRNNNQDESYDFRYEGWNGSMDEFMLFHDDLSSGEVSDLWDVSKGGELTTQTKEFPYKVSPSKLKLSDVAASLNGQDVTFRVKSDPDADGTFEETSDQIVADGSGSYDISGLSSNSTRYRVVVNLSTSSVIAGPSVSGFVLGLEKSSALYYNPDSPVTIRLSGTGANLVNTYFGTTSDATNISENFTIDTSAPANVTVHEYNQSAENVTNFSVTMDKGDMTVTLDSLESDSDYVVYQDGERYKNTSTDANGQLSFTKDEDWSTHSFRVAAASDSGDSDDGGMTVGPGCDGTELFNRCIGVNPLVLGTGAAVVAALTGMVLYRRVQ